MELTILFAAVAALTLLAVTSMRYGVDSREGFASKERELAARGVAWSRSLPQRNRRAAPGGRTIPLNLPGHELNDDCRAAPCGA